MPDELLKPDLSLLRDIRPEDTTQLKQIHLSHFNKGDKDLYYIGTHHGTDFENKTHETIIQAIGKHHPQVVILEGIDTDKGLSPSLGFNPKNPSDRERFFMHSGENVHTAEFLRSKNIPFVGGEPSVSTIFQALEKNGYSSKDSMALYLMRTIPIWKREGLLADNAHFATQANGFLANSSVFAFIPKEERLTFDEFKTWYDAHKSELGNKDMLAVTASDSNPRTSNPNYFQKMSGIMDRVRNEHLVTLVAGSLAAKDKVLVVYGNAHQCQSTPVYEKMFGSKATIEQLVLEENRQPAQAPPTIPATTAIRFDKDTLVASKPSKTSVLLKYGSVALLAAAGTAAAILGVVSVPAIALLAGSALAFAGSEIIPSASPEMQMAKAFAVEQPQKPVYSIDSQQPIAARDNIRSDGKSWVASSRASQDASRAI